MDASSCPATKTPADRGTTCPAADTGQIGLCWVPIAELQGLRFYPNDIAAILAGALEDRVYLGDV